LFLVTRARRAWVPMKNDIPAPAVLVLDTDRTTLELLREWLTEAGWAVVDDDRDPDGAARFHLVLIDIPYPRQGRSTSLQRIAAEHAGTPVLALSATLHASVEPCGDVARALGVAGVLPKPIRRDALLAAVRTLSRPPG
jgi:DNA-binding response OmpR family regulator